MQCMCSWNGGTPKSSKIQQFQYWYLWFLLSPHLKMHIYIYISISIYIYIHLYIYIYIYMYLSVSLLVYVHSLVDQFHSAFHPLEPGLRAHEWPFCVFPRALRAWQKWVFTYMMDYKCIICIIYICVCVNMVGYSVSNAVWTCIKNTPGYGTAHWRLRFLSFWGCCISNIEEHGLGRKLSANFIGHRAETWLRKMAARSGS